MVLAEAAFSAGGIKRASGQPYGLIPSMAKVEDGRLVWTVTTATIGSGWRVRIDDASGEAGRVTRWGLR